MCPEHHDRRNRCNASTSCRKTRAIARSRGRRSSTGLQAPCHRTGPSSCHTLQRTVVQRQPLRHNASDTLHDNIKARGSPFHVNNGTPDSACLVHAQPATTLSTSAIFSVKPRVSVSRCSYYKDSLLGCCKHSLHGCLQHILPAESSACYTYVAQGLGTSGD